MDLAHFWNTSGAYQINQSLRFNSADSAGLTRTQTTNNESSDFTISFWVKKAYNGDNNMMLLHLDNGSVYSYISFGESTSDEDMLVARGTASGYAFRTDRKYRDNSAWYHVVLSVDAGTITKGWINGVLDRDTGATSGWRFNGAYTLGMGRTAAGSNYFNGYLAEWHFVDGQALTAADFGETDPITGAWIPKKYSGSYGTNGYYLKFDPSATNGIGHDHSGNGNNWTATGFSTSGTGTDVLSDTPTNNWCTLNPTDVLVSYVPTFIEGNLQVNHVAGTGGYSFAAGTIGFESNTTTGWYFEATATDYTASSYLSVGLLDTDQYTVSKLSSGVPLATSTNSNSGIGFESTSGYLRNYGTTESGWDSAGGTTWTTDGDIIMVAIKNNKIYFGKNGTWLKSADPSTESNPAITLASAKKFVAATGGLASAKITFNFGQRSFSYTPPTGFKALNTANLPEPTIKKGSKYFDTVLWTGDGTAGRSITGLNFSPDLVWLKNRSDTYAHQLHDAVRGASAGALYSNLTNAQDSNFPLTSFDSAGFTLGNTASLASQSQGSQNYNGNGFVAWAWDANGVGSSNTAGTITSTVSANATAGFSIATYTGNGTAGATIGHGLGVAPSMIITKRRDSTSVWNVYHSALGATKVLYLNQTSSQQIDSSVWNNTSPSSTVFTVGTDSNLNASSGTFVAYCFSEVAGYSKFGSYTGNSSSDGPFVHLGFRPRFIWIKATTSVLAGYDGWRSWYMVDTARYPYNSSDENQLWANLSATEDKRGDGSSAGNLGIDILSNGFKVRRDSSYAVEINYTGATYIYCAWAENPFKYANAR